MVASQSSPTASSRTVAAYLALLQLSRERGYVVTRVKVAKLLYLADLAAVRGGDEPISGVEWKWLDHGPFNNILQHLENNLVDSNIVQREPYYAGYQVRLIGDLPGYQMAPEDLIFLERAVAEYGSLAATSLKDLSYQTPPMIDAQKRGKGVVLDLSLARPRPKLVKLASKMTAVLSRLPEQDTDYDVFDEIEREMDDLAEMRRKASSAVLHDE
ncbi:SocA family protein [Natronosporangium hydrolyticum]|uniref:SocA family protein n=1 Tax=Natronosporangium hydrolyticum TaxID=2811111 RepID=A0A895YJJ8_9ACTN|nr:Panacea domain-containing protein [Natronosporangium hydrolyticum]QSB13958.1 SocA family protein [Natronosporangium hydrolyticum]